MLSSNRQPKLSRTSPKKCEIPGASFIRRQNPRKHRSIRTAKKEIAPVLRNKNRLAPLTIKPPKLQKYAAQSRKKRRRCHQKSAAAAQYSTPHPARDHTNTPRQQQKNNYKALSSPGTEKARTPLAKHRKIPRLAQNFSRRTAAMWQYNSLLCPQKSDNLS